MPDQATFSEIFYDMRDLLTRYTTENCFDCKLRKKKANEILTRIKEISIKEN